MNYTSVRTDILQDLYKAIDDFTNQIAEANDITDLRFGNIMELRDELETGKRYSERRLNDNR